MADGQLNEKANIFMFPINRIFLYFSYHRTNKKSNFCVNLDTGIKNIRYIASNYINFTKRNLSFEHF